MRSQIIYAVLAATLPAACATSLETGSEPGLSLDILTQHQSPPHPVHLRLPPVFGSKASPSWEPMPPGWYFGTWYFTYTNQATYHSFKNLQYTLNPTPDNNIFPFRGTLNDLTTAQNTTTGQIYEYYGVDYPTAGTLDSYAYTPTGPLSPFNNTYEAIGWGYDRSGVAWWLVFETKTLLETTESIDIFSRSDEGPCEDTVQEILRAIKNLGNARLNALLPNLAKLKMDGARRGTPYPSCNATCMQNAYAL